MKVGPKKRKAAQQPGKTFEVVPVAAPASLLAPPSTSRRGTLSSDSEAAEAVAEPCVASVTKKRSSRAVVKKAKKKRSAGTADADVRVADAAASPRPANNLTSISPNTEKYVGEADGPGAAPSKSAKINTFVPTDGPYTYNPDPDDHCETDVRAYKHLKPVLVQLERVIHPLSGDQLRLWDPYYCNGAVKRNLASIGFPRVHNENEDFYEIVRSGKLPEHDVVVTSPPYSSDHLERCMRFVATSSKPCCVLLPNWVASKDYYKELLRSCKSWVKAPPMYLGPVGTPYNYWFPEGAERPEHVGDDGRTTPYRSCWYIFIPAKLGGPGLVKTLDVEMKKSGEWVIARTVKGLKWNSQKFLQRKPHLGQGGEPDSATAHWQQPQNQQKNRVKKKTLKRSVVR